MKNKGVVFLTVILLLMVLLNMVLPIFVIESYSYYSGASSESFNLFKLISTDYLYSYTKTIGVLVLLIMIAGAILIIVGAITCYNDISPKKGLAIAGTAMEMFASFVLMIVGFVAPSTFGDPGIGYGEIYFGLVVGSGIYFMVLCSRKKYVPKYNMSQSQSSDSSEDPTPDTTADPNAEGLVFGELVGAQRVLNVFEDRIELVQLQNFRSVLTHDFFKGTKEIPFASMTSIQFKEPSSMILGYIQFEVPGTHTSSNFGSENSWTFELSMLPIAKNVAEYCKKRIRELHTTKVVVQQESKSAEPVSSVADEIRKFKSLLDDGIITQEEFDKKKKELLGS